MEKRKRTTWMDDVAALLREGHTVTLRVKGNSMYPFLVDGRDCVVLQPATDVQTGDIVLANIPSLGYVLHRVYAIRAEHLLLMGDGNLTQQETCRRSDICGTVVRMLRCGHAVDCSSRKERLLATAWMRLLPLRRALLPLCRCMKKRN